MPNTLVIDASAMVDVLLGTQRADAILEITDGAEVVAPDLINMETLSALRRLAQRGIIDSARAVQAINDLQDAPLELVLTSRLLHAAWNLRANLSAYDACYVALAEALSCPLITTDIRLSRAPGLSVNVLVP